MTITVHGNPSCVQCRATERHVDSKGIEIEYVDLSEDLDTLAKLKSRGLAQAPVVIVLDDDGVEIDHWTEYNPDKLNEHGAKQKELALAVA